MVHSLFYKNLRDTTLVCLYTTLALILSSTTVQSQNRTVLPFSKVVISPYIQVVFQQSEKESVVVSDINIPISKLNIEVKNNKLCIYLEGAQNIPKTKKKGNQNVPIYKNATIKVVINYKHINEITLKGDKKASFNSPFKQDRLALTIYGESNIALDDISLKEFDFTVYGESRLEIKKGTINTQKITTYGESKIEALNVENKTTKITTYGENNFRLNILEKLRITCYGESTIQYTGNPEISKGIVIGKSNLKHLP